MALSTNISPSDIAAGTYQPDSRLPAGETTSGTAWTANGSGSQAYSTVGGPVTPGTGNANHE